MKYTLKNSGLQLFAQPTGVDPANQVAPTNGKPYAATAANTLTEWATAGGFEVDAVIQAAKSGDFFKVNEFYNYLTNKIVSQGVENYLEFQNNFTKVIGYGTKDPMISMAEYLITDIIPAEDYDPDMRIATKDYIERVQKFVISAEDKKKWTITTAPTQLLSAFSSEQSAVEFTANIMDKFAQSVEVYLQNVITDLVVKNVKNVKATANKLSGGFDKVAAEILETMSDWSLPVNSGISLGTQNGALTDDAKVFMNAKFSDLIVVGKPSTLKKFQTQMATIYHNNDLQLQGFAGVIEANVGANEIYFIHKRAIKINRRIEETQSQYYAANMKTDTYKHLWYTMGMLTVAPGIKWTLTATTK